MLLLCVLLCGVEIEVDFDFDVDGWRRENGATYTLTLIANNLQTVSILSRSRFLVYILDPSCLRLMAEWLLLRSCRRCVE